MNQGASKRSSQPIAWQRIAPGASVPRVLPAACLRMARKDWERPLGIAVVTEPPAVSAANDLVAVARIVAARAFHGLALHIRSPLRLRD